MNATSSSGSHLNILFASCRRPSSEYPEELTMTKDLSTTENAPSASTAEAEAKKKSTRRSKRKASYALKTAEKKRHVEKGSRNSRPDRQKEKTHQHPSRQTRSSGAPKSSGRNQATLNAEELVVFEKLKRRLEQTGRLADNATHDESDNESNEASSPGRETRRNSMKKNSTNSMPEEDDDDDEKKLSDESDTDEDDDEMKGHGGIHSKVDASDDEQVVSLGIRNNSSSDVHSAGASQIHSQIPLHLSQPSEPAPGPEKIAHSTQECSFVDHVVVMNLFKELKSFITQIDGKVDSLVTDVKKDRETMGKLEAHVEELSTVISTSASAMFIKQPNAPPRLKEIHKKLCLLPALFNEKFMLKVLSRSLIGSFLNMIENNMSYISLETAGLDMLSIMYFAKQNNEKSKEKYSSAIGKLFSKFRQSYLTTAFLAMQNNSFQTFSDHEVMSDITTVSPGPLSSDIFATLSSGTDEDTSPGMGNFISQPFWLKPRFVRIEHCHSALIKSERRQGAESTDNSQVNGESFEVEPIDSSQSSARSKVNPRSGPITNEEIATEASYMVAKIITGILYKCRPSSKLELFNNVLYLFTGWAQHDISIDQNSLQLKWLKPASHDVDYMERIPTVRTVKLAELGKFPDSGRQQLDLNNMKRLESFIGKHPELTLVVEHDVNVCDKPRRLHRRISLIETITKLISSYCTLESNSKLRETLGIHKYCLKTVVVMALGLRKLMEKAVQDLNSKSLVLWSGNSGYVGTKGKRGRPKKSTTADSNAPTNLPTYKFETVNGLSVDGLLPSVSKQKVNLGQMILSLTEEEYSVKNYVAISSLNRSNDVNTDMGRDQDDNDQTQKDCIEVDEQNGIFVM